MDKSWIKLYRNLLYSPIFENEKGLKIWIWCLLKATHIDRNQLVGQQIVELKKGQFVFGRKKASEELKMISMESNNKFSVVTVKKWEDYQLEDLKSNNKVTTTFSKSNSENRKIRTTK